MSVSPRPISKRVALGLVARGDSLARSRDMILMVDELIERRSSETCDRRGPYCPETHQACERMCQSICNMRTGEPAKAHP